MGAHSIGSLARENSGFDGEKGWVMNNKVLDNSYHRMLVGPNGEVYGGRDWTQKVVDNSALRVDDDDPDTAYASLDAHRQTFDAFVDAFTTYKPLLSEIKRRYDRALDGALRAERACAGLRAEVAAAERRRLAEVRDARAETMTKAANVRGAALRRAAAAEAKAAAAATTCQM